MAAMAQAGRVKISAKRYQGKLVEWKGKFGWIQPLSPIDHPDAGKRGGKVFMGQEEVETEIELRGIVSFLVYRDANGLGAMHVRNVAFADEPAAQKASPAKGAAAKGAGKSAGKAQAAAPQWTPQQAPASGKGWQAKGAGKAAPATYNSGAVTGKGAGKAAPWAAAPAGKGGKATAAAAASSSSAGAKPVPWQRVGATAAAATGGAAQRSFSSGARPALGAVTPPRASPKVTGGPTIQVPKAKALIPRAAAKPGFVRPGVVPKFGAFAQRGLAAARARLATVAPTSKAAPTIRTPGVQKKILKSGAGPLLKPKQTGKDGAAAGAAEERAPPPAPDKTARQRIVKTRMTGKLFKWRGHIGFIKPSEPIVYAEDAEKAKKANFRGLFLHEADVDKGQEVAKGCEVSFFVYADPQGLGAEHVRKTKDAAPGETAPKAKAKAAANVPKAAAKASSGEVKKTILKSAATTGAGKGTGKGKDKPVVEKRPQRNRVSTDAIWGEVVEWKKTFGWIKPFEEFQHEKAKKGHEGKIYVHAKDVVGEQKNLSEGSQVEFHIYADTTGLGAEEVNVLY